LIKKISSLLSSPHQLSPQSPLVLRVSPSPGRRQTRPQRRRRVRRRRKMQPRTGTPGVSTAHGLGCRKSKIGILVVTYCIRKLFNVLEVE